MLSAHSPGIDIRQFQRNFSAFPLGGARPPIGVQMNLANLKPQFPLTSAAIPLLHRGRADLGVDHENITSRRFSIAVVRHFRHTGERELVQQPEQQHYV